jgi:hypothetical protein
MCFTVEENIQHSSNRSLQKCILNMTCHTATVWKFIKKFKETGTVADMPRSGRLTVLAQKRVMNICDHIMRRAKSLYTNYPSTQHLL